jgi:hypothetical protein
LTNVIPARDRFAFLPKRWPGTHRLPGSVICQERVIRMRTLGRSDRVDLPKLGLYNVPAKVDTGAYNCSIHCSDVRVVNGALEFCVLDADHPEYTGSKFTFRKFRQKQIRNSFGESELRYVIRTQIKIFERLIRAEFSLSNRGNLKFPVLLGRKILRDRFVIDVTQKDLYFNSKKESPGS